MLLFNKQKNLGVRCTVFEVGQVTLTFVEEPEGLHACRGLVCPSCRGASELSAVTQCWGSVDREQWGGGGLLLCSAAGRALALQLRSCSGLLGAGWGVW